jgi:ATPase subunit of ABC transporter with duplicated ATPase domains
MNRGEDAEMIIVAISHNRSFLEEICSDTILYQDQKLTQYPVPFVEFWKLIDEKKRRDKTRFEVQAKREAKLKNEIAKLQSSASKVKGFLFSLLISFVFNALLFNLGKFESLRSALFAEKQIGTIK